MSTLRKDINEYRWQVRDRLEGRDIQKLVEELIYQSQDVIIDEVGGWAGMDIEDELHQDLVYDIVMEQLIKVYFTPKKAPARIEDI